MSAIDELKKKATLTDLEYCLVFADFQGLPENASADEAAAEYAALVAKVEAKDKELWAINDELVKAGLKPTKYESFALCVATLRAENEKLKKTLCMDRNDRPVQLWKLFEELDAANKAVAFVNALLDEYYPDPGDIDGGTFQELAVKHGILVAEIRHEPCGEACACAEAYYPVDWIEGVECFRPAVWLTAHPKEQE